MKGNYQIACEVVLGKWGNGRERMERLTAAGYDAEAVQSIVNAIIWDGYTEPEPAGEKFLEVEVDLDEYAGINLKFRKGGQQ